MKYLSDTNWAIDLLNGQPDAVALEPTLLHDGLTTLNPRTGQLIMH